ncbi:hypothetical protein KQI42_10020 [Tissierella sp. MSJ-40]|uniref:Uncharacterized protein n=1 Tax=Tissierella simiarum TaxID=2841534 RepID=A0ABS6E608_9FIRM|nr:hypothetical protein [Tissierella simiarum]MBU5438347.1 hypothetical protein [Tissierella simiarum]
MRNHKFILKWEKQRKLGWLLYSLITSGVRTSIGAIIMMAGNMLIRKTLYVHPLFTCTLLGIAIGSFLMGSSHINAMKRDIKS